MIPFQFTTDQHPNVMTAVSKRRIVHKFSFVLFRW